MSDWIFGDVPVNLVLVGDSGAGKGEQIRRIFTARDADGTQPFRPALFVTCESSSTVSGHELISSPDCRRVAVTTPEELEAVLETILPQGLNGQPFRLVIFDGWSQFQEQTKHDERQKTKDKHDNRVMAAKAGPRMRSAAAAWTEACQKSRAVFVSTCHIVEDWRQRPGSKDLGDRMRMGLKMDLSSEPAKFIKREGNAIVYLGRVVRDVTPPDLSVFNDEDAFDEYAEKARIAHQQGSLKPLYLGFFHPVKFLGDDVEFVKWQDGLFDPAKVGPLKRNPNLGEMLLDSPLRRTQ